MAMKGNGLTNQLFSLISGIILAYKRNERVIVVDHFLNDFSKNDYTPITQIFNIRKTNNYLQNKYNIIIVDKYYAQFTLNSVKYGINSNIEDITDYILQNHCQNNGLCINKNIVLNDIKGDPCYGVKKQLFLNYTINDYKIEENYDEKLTHDIRIDFLNSEYIYTFLWIHSLDTNIFEDILQHIEYNDELITTSQFILNKIDTNNKINAIHLRLEYDAINHWAKYNHMSHGEFQSAIEKKYIEVIKKYISKSDETIILSSSLNNVVINYLLENEYNIVFSEKFFAEREKNAIIDLLISKYCNNVFIGNWHIANKTGSTFSYYIGKILKDNITKIYLDLDKINDPEMIVN